MNTMLKTMVENYKALIDEHKKDYNRGCYETVEDYREVLGGEYRNMLDALQGIARYDAINWEDYSTLSNECFEYAMRAGIV